MVSKAQRNGFHVHDGVIVVYDEDFDERVLGVLDSIDTTGLLVASERKGNLRLTWAHRITGELQNRTGITAKDGDEWLLEHVFIDVFALGLQMSVSKGM